VYLYNFRVLDLERIPSVMSGSVKNVYAFVNLGMAAFVMATIAARFVFPAVSAEGAAFWIIRTAPIRMRDFLWSKFWMGLIPIVILSELLTVVANEFLRVDPFLKLVTASAIVLLSFALVGLATGMGARYPRFGADNASQVAGSYGGVTFMILAVLVIFATIALLGWGSSQLLWHRARGRALTGVREIEVIVCFLAAAAISVGTWWFSMRDGVRALEQMDRTPS
jgi:ABC-2 type transport system permease protein